MVIYNFCFGYGWEYRKKRKDDNIGVSCLAENVYVCIVFQMVVFVFCVLRGYMVTKKEECFPKAQSSVMCVVK